MDLNERCSAALRGDGGPVLAKVTRVVVEYGQAMDAVRMVEIDFGGHFSPSDPAPAVGMRLEMLEELVEAGLRTTLPFTLDPRGPLALDGLRLSEEERSGFISGSRQVPRYHELMMALGLRDKDAYTCTPYLPEVGNRPRRDAVVAWSESSCVVYANSVLGARANRTPAILDLFSNILGFTPEFGLLTPEGRRATWLVELRVRRLPEPQLLGALIAREVVSDVPYITGLDALLGPGLSSTADDYLKEMGAACAAVGGAVGLLHVEGITPEAVDDGRKVLASDHRRFVVDDAALDEISSSYRGGAAGSARPERCMVGCPHLSVAELRWWVQAIEGRLDRRSRGAVAVETILAAAPQVIEAFLGDEAWAERARRIGVVLSPACLETFMDNPASARRPTVTTSNKLRAYTAARLVSADELLAVVADELGGRA
jgi:predicted aconitase